LSLVYGSVTGQFPDSANPVSKSNSARMRCIQLNLQPFCVIFWPILANNRLPWQRPLNSCNQKCLHWIGRPQKHPAISYRILVTPHCPLCTGVSQMNSRWHNFVPKLVAMVTPLCPLCTGVSVTNSPMAQTQSQNQTLHGSVAFI